jgi:hypothetical protein
MKKLLLSLKFIFMPSYWIMNYPYSREWDIKLNELLDNHEFTEIGHYYAKLGNANIWITNHPYASMTLRNPDIGVRPSRLTIERVKKALEKATFSKIN